MIFSGKSLRSIHHEALGLFTPHQHPNEALEGGLNLEQRTGWTQLCAFVFMTVDASQMVNTTQRSFRAIHSFSQKPGV